MTQRTRPLRGNSSMAAGKAFKGAGNRPTGDRVRAGHRLRTSVQ